MRVKLFLLLFVAAQAVLGQDPNFPLQQQFDPDVEELFAKARAQMEAEDYEGANVTFRKALATKKVLPTAMSYFLINFSSTVFGSFCLGMTPVTYHQ